jgi:three-Cys-motif partner protein
LRAAFFIKEWSNTLSKKKPYNWSNSRKPPLLQPHSIAKHEVIEAYLERYIEVLTADPRQDALRLTIVDGFSGGGMYRHAETGELCSGSPLIFLDTIRRMEAQIQAQRTKDFHIDAHYYFIDSDAMALSFLKSQLRKQGYGNMIGEKIFLLNGSFSHLFPGLMEVILARRGRVLFLLDQYGYKDTPLPMIRQIFVRCPTAEVLLTFAVDALVNYIANRKQFRECVNNLDPSGRLLSNEDIRDVERLKKKVSPSGASAQWRLMIEQKLLKRVVRMSGAKHYTPYFIVSHQSHRAYWFLHLSTHIKAWDEMVKLHWQHHNCFVHHGTPGLNMFGFDPHNRAYDFRFDEAAEEQSNTALSKQLPRLIYAKDGITFRDLLISQSNRTPASSDIFKNVLNMLRAEGDIKIIDHRSGKPRRTLGHWDNHILSKHQDVHILH